MDKTRAYQEAELLDQQIDKLLEEFPPTGENLLAWMLFVRTIRTTVDLLEYVIHKPSFNKNKPKQETDSA